jgi:hypothetical protein
MRRSLLLLLSVLVCSPLLAERPAIPALTVKGDDGTIALDVTALKIRVTIRGHLARTEYELTYHNSLDRVTGGDFHFPLPADTEVSDIGLYFNGHLRHGVAVERVLARNAYEETVHRGVDPALAEWNSGRQFRFGVYPIPANGDKQVFLAYDQELIGNGYALDLRYGKKLSLDVAIDSDGREPAIEGSLHFERERGAYVMHTRDEVIDGVVRVARDDAETALIAYSAADKAWYGSAAIDLKSNGSEMAPAAHVVILYDTSSSSVQQNAAQLRKFITSFLARQTAWTTADVIPFHIAIDPNRHVERAATLAGQREVERVLTDLQPLGATNLFAIVSELSKSTATLPPNTRVVLVTDGLTSLGDSREVAAAVSKLADLHRPILVVNSSATADDQLLGNIARTTGGWWIDLTRVDVDAAVTTAMRVPASVHFPAEIFPSAVVTTGDERFAIATRSTDAIVRMPHDVPLRDIAESDLVRRAFARAKLREMLAHGASDEELLAHGREFTQLTPRTSLLVLESWRDYEMYGIPLPPDVQAEKDAEQHSRKKPSSDFLLVSSKWFVQGRVTDDEHNPLPGVTVSLFNDEKLIAVEVTDTDGRFSLSAPSSPANPKIVAELSGFARAERKFDHELPAGASLEFVLSATVMESITVTAEQTHNVEAVDAVAVPPSLRGSIATTDQLLNQLAADAPPDSDDPEVLETVAKHRFELTRQVIAKLRGINSTSERVRYYLSARALLGGDKGFHVFAAEVFRDRSPEIAARILSDLAEARSDDAPLLRILGRVLDGWGESELARLFLTRSMEIEPDQPQTWRELMILDAKRGRAMSVATLAKRAKEMEENGWEGAAVYQQIDDVIARAEKQRGADVRADAQDDITIELMFDTGWSWVDLHIIEPGGEEVTWNHDTSKAGATFTGGFTFGFGPEIYTLRHAPRGDYRLDIDYYMSDATNVSRETLAHVIVYTRGRHGNIERHEHFVVLQLDEEHRTLETIRMN